MIGMVCRISGRKHLVVQLRTGEIRRPLLKAVQPISSPPWNMDNMPFTDNSLILWGQLLGVCTQSLTTSWRGTQLPQGSLTTEDFVHRSFERRRFLHLKCNPSKAPVI